MQHKLIQDSVSVRRRTEIDILYVYYYDCFRISQLILHMLVVLLISKSVLYFLVLAKGGSDVKATTTKLARKPSV